MACLNSSSSPFSSLLPTKHAVDSFKCFSASPEVNIFSGHESKLETRLSQNKRLGKGPKSLDTEKIRWGYLNGQDFPEKVVEIF